MVTGRYRDMVISILEVGVRHTDISHKTVVFNGNFKDYCSDLEIAIRDDHTMLLKGARLIKGTLVLSYLKAGINHEVTAYHTPVEESRLRAL